MISVIIPVFNHADELQACLASLMKQTVADIEIIIVDDGSIEPVQPIVADWMDRYHPNLPIKVMRFDRNRGAPAARNEGFRASIGEEVIFLDADVVLMSTALEQMLAALEHHPEASFAYASYYFGWKLFRLQAFDGQRLKIRNFIHTSSLLRRSAFLGFDETLKRFQDWDLWLRLAAAGQQGIWINRPLFRIKPRHAGMSHWLPTFMYRIPWPLLGYQPKEIKTYRQAERIIQQKHGIPATISQSATEKRYLVQIATWFCGIGLMEALSFAALAHPKLNAVIAVSFALAVFVLTLLRPATALSILSVEYVVGSKGSVFKIGGNGSNDGGVSVRILMFAAFVFAWGMLALKRRWYRSWNEYLPGRWSWIALVSLVLYGLIRGWLLNDHGLALLDAKRWGMLLGLLPLIDILRRHLKIRDRQTIVAPLIAAVVWTPFQTLLLFYVFSHHFSGWHLPVYLWMRRTGLGEITPITGSLYRIFFQSHIYALTIILSIFSWLAYQRRRQRWLIFLATISLAELFASLSRSLFLGLGLSCVFFIICLLRRKVTIRPLIKPAIIVVGLSAILLSTIIFFPWPSTGGGSLVDLARARLNLQEDAAVSRWNLLPAMIKKIAQRPMLGSGFGATVTYESRDPRLVASGRAMSYTTFSFEWGWLEHWIKFGLLGIPTMLWLLWSLADRSRRSHQPDWLRLAMISAIVAIGATHIFTPYLNHPLGFFALFIVEALLILDEKRSLEINKWRQL